MRVNRRWYSVDMINVPFSSYLPDVIRYTQSFVFTRTSVGVMIDLYLLLISVLAKIYGGYVELLSRPLSKV